MAKKKYLSIEQLNALECIKAITYLLEIMEELLLKSGVHPGSYARTREKFSKINDVTFKDFLIGVYVNEFEQVRKAYNNLPPHAWENYKLLYDEANMPEQIHLAECQKILRKKWYERPTRKKKNPKSSK